MSTQATADIQDGAKSKPLRIHQYVLLNRINAC